MRGTATSECLSDTRCATARARERERVRKGRQRVMGSKTRGPSASGLLSLALSLPLCVARSAVQSEALPERAALCKAGCVSLSVGHEDEAREKEKDSPVHFGAPTRTLDGLLYIPPAPSQRALARAAPRSRLDSLVPLLEELDALLLALAAHLAPALPPELPTGEVVRADERAREGAHAHGGGDRPAAEPGDEARRAAARCAGEAGIARLDEVGDAVVDVGEGERGGGCGRARERGGGSGRGAGVRELLTRDQRRTTSLTGSTSS